MERTSWACCLRSLVVVIASVLASASTARASAQGGDWRWGGRLSDVFAFDTGQGTEAWTVEDGGRIRHRNPTTGVWSMQTVPDDVKDTLRRVHFLTSGPNAGKMGWAVGADGWVLKTTNGGSTWATVGTRIPAAGTGYGPWEDLQDIHFVDEEHGWLVGLHSLFASFDGGSSWYSLPVINANGSNVLDLTLPFNELYAIDVAELGNGERLGLVVMQPGYVLRSYASDAQDPNHFLTDWHVAWDVLSLCPCGTGLTGCICAICNVTHIGPWFEPWDVEIGTNASDPLALLVGGTGVTCGTILAATEPTMATLGLSWHVEPHECTCSGSGCHPTHCDGDPLYNPNPLNPNQPYRHKYYRTLYGLAIHDDTNVASAVGYNGQMLVRDPVNGVWQDRSMYAVAVPEAPGSVVFGLLGTDTDPGAGEVILTGYGGHLMESGDAGQTWVNATGANGVIDGSQNRTNDVFFVNEQFGWQAGQFFLIAKSSDFGFHWDKQLPNPAKNLPNCEAITFEPSGSKGVAVGGSHFSDPSDPLVSVPKIRWTNSGGQPQWSDDVTILGDGYFIDGKGLVEVDWAPGAGSLDFWAVGDGGLILSTNDGGQTWTLFQPAGDPGLAGFDLSGVGFRDTVTGLFVGKRSGAGSAWQYRDVGGVTWTAMTIQLLDPGDTLLSLTDVDVVGNVAWAVGEKSLNGTGEIEGLVLKSAATGSGSFGDFVEQAPQPPVAGFPQCQIGPGLTAEDPVLSEVEIAPGGDVWFGGMCGRVWVLRSTGAWQEVKSQTDAHVTGFSFVPSGSGAAGYVAGFRGDLTQQVIVKVQ